MLFRSRAGVYGGRSDQRQRDTADNRPLFQCRKHERLRRPGGIVSFNSGGVFNCELSDNFGNAGLDYIGGIAGLNVNASYNGAGSTGTAEEYRYRDVKGTSWNYTSGTIARCSTDAGRNISGRSCVGGIAGYNLPGGILKENQNKANITAAGNYAGGIAGSNAGRISLRSEERRVGKECRL